MYSLAANMGTSSSAITTSCNGLVFPMTAPKEIRTAAAVKSAVIRLKHKRLSAALAVGIKWQLLYLFIKLNEVYYNRETFFECNYSFSLLCYGFI